MTHICDFEEHCELLRASSLHLDSCERPA
jgi:hypothetical protein